MLQVVNPQRCHTRSLDCAVPGLRSCRCHRIAAEGEDPFSVFAELLLQNGDNFALQRNRDGATCLGLIRICDP